MHTGDLTLLGGQACSGSWQFQLQILSLWKVSIFLSQMTQWRWDSWGLGRIIFPPRKAFSIEHIFDIRSSPNIILALFLIWLVTHYEHHTIFSWTWQFWGLISHCPKQTPPPVHSSWLYSYHNWIIPEQSLKILPSCTPWLLNSFFKQSVIFWDSQLLTTLTNSLLDNVPLNKGAFLLKGLCVRMRRMILWL